MVRSFCLLMCVMALAPGAAFAGSIPTSGFEAGAAAPTGQPFAYNLDNNAFEPDSALPGASSGMAFAGTSVIRNSENFDGNVFVGSAGELLGQNASCGSGAAAFCAQPTLRIGENKPVLFATSSADYVTDGDPFAVNPTFAGAEPSRASLSSDAPSVVPEPGSMILFGSGIVSLLAIRRTRKL
jgi:hypothetical protein